jgi:hypothetical protein
MDHRTFAADGQRCDLLRHPFLSALSVTISARDTPVDLPIEHASM